MSESIPTTLVFLLYMTWSFFLLTVGCMLGSALEHPEIPGTCDVTNPRGVAFRACPPHCPTASLGLSGSSSGSPPSPQPGCGRR